MTRLISSARALGGVSMMMLLGVACGGRPASFDATFDPGREERSDPSDPSGNLQVRGLNGSVALLDPSLNQVMMFTSPQKLALTTTRLPVGRDVVRFDRSVNGVTARVSHPYLAPPRE